MVHKPKCEFYDTNTNRNSSESHLYWKNHFHKNPIYFKKYAVFKADSEIDTSNKSNKATNFCNRIPVLNGYRIISKTDDILKGGDYNFSLG